MPRATLVVKISLAILLLVTSFVVGKGGLIGALIYGAPYIVALFLHARYTSFAIGLSLGALLIEFPIVLFFSFFGGIFSPDPKELLPMRIYSLTLLLTGIACVFAYFGDRENMDGGTTMGAGMLSLTYVLVVTAVASSHRSG